MSNGAPIRIIYYRVYYNHAHAWPFVWSVDDGDQAHEQTCEGVVMNDCNWRTKALSPEERNGLDPETVPMAWIEVQARDAVRTANAIVFIPPPLADY